MKTLCTCAGLSLHSLTSSRVGVGEDWGFGSLANLDLLAGSWQHSFTVSQNQTNILARFFWQACTLGGGGAACEAPRPVS